MKTIRLATMLLIMLSALSCSRKGATPSTEFAEYIKAYTGGPVTEASTIKVQLNPGIEVKDLDGLFSFKPALKGSANFNGNTVEFIPDPGQLEGGKVYRCNFRLDKVIPGIRKDLRKFCFSFLVAPSKNGAGAAEAQTGDGKTGFRVLSARMDETADPFIEVTFSEPVADMDDFKGIITLEGAQRYYTSIKDATARIYYEGRNKGPVTIKIADVLKSAAGNALGEAYEQSFDQSGVFPAVTIPLSGNILPDPSSLTLPFRAVNLKAIDVRIIKIYSDNVLTFLQDNSLDGNGELRRSGRLIYKTTVRLDQDPEKDLTTWQDFSIDLSGLMKQEPGAIYRVRLSFTQDYSLYGKEYTGPEEMSVVPEGITAKDEATWDMTSTYYWDNSVDWSTYNWNDRDNPLTPSYYMENSRFPECNLMTSDLGIIVKSAATGKLWISVNDIMTTKPVYGAELEAYNFQLRPIGRGRTGSDGMAEIPVEGKPFVVVARRGKSVSYLKVSDAEAKSLSRFDVGGSKVENGLKAYIYGERGVWRPGDTLHVTMILRDKGQTLPQGHPATIEVFTPQGQFYNRTVSASAGDGFYAFAIPTAADAPTGVWNAYLKIGGSTFHKALRVETIKPNRLKINTNFSSKVLSAGERSVVSISSSWLTGPAAAGLQASSEMTLTPSAHKFKGFENYIFKDPTSSFTKSEEKILNARLDGQGNASANVLMPKASGAPGMLTASIMTTVTEPGGDASFTVQTIPYSPFSAYVGINVPQKGEYLETDKDHYFKVATLDKNGHRVSGHNLEYRIYKLEWSWWWESRAEELDSYINGTGANLFSSGRLVSGNTDASVPFRIDYPDWGRFLVYVKDLDSGHATGAIFMADWPEYRGRSEKTDPDALTMITFSTDKKEYEAGQTATVFVPAAEGGRALVSLENASGVIAREWVSTSGKGDTPYKFKITPEMAPNFYVHITLLQPHKNSANDLPIRMYGVQPVSVVDKGSRIEPVISMADAVHPEEEFQIKVSEKSGRGMTYTLAIVDEGLLDLTAFKTPDPWNAMYSREALGVKTWDLYDNVIGAYSGRFAPMLSIGGDEDIVVGPKKDNRFNPVVRFLGPFTLEKGSQTHKIKLPMYVGSVRVMVVAGNGEAFGNAEKAVAVRSPLMILPTVPRVLSTGDKLTIPVNVFAMEDNVRNVKVSIKLDGPVRLTGESSRSLNFSATGDKMTGFPVEATGEGTATITVSAASGNLTATETIAVPVRNPNPVLTRTQQKAIAAGEEIEFSFKAFNDDKDNTATVELAGFPIIDVDGVFSNMKNYRYSCTEQLAARGLTFLHLHDMFCSNNAEEVSGMIPEILQEIYSRQLPDGGFAYWPGQVDAVSWVSSMAGQFMAEASAKGYEVNAGVLSAWENYQKSKVQSYRFSSGKFLNDMTQAYRLYTLAIAGKPDNGAMNRLRENGSVSAQARWLLASAYAICGKAQTAESIIQSIDEGFTEYTPDNETYGSGLRDKAIAIEALVLTGQTGRALQYAGELTSVFGPGYSSTQETAFASIAMERLASKVNSSAISAVINGKEVKTAKAVYSSRTDGSTGLVKVKNNSEGPLYATLVTTGRVPAGTQIPAKSSGMRLNVTYTDEKGNALNQASIAQGTEFTSVITVTNTNGLEDYTNLALSQMIPSGWEIINERLSGAVVASQNSYDYNDIRDDRSIWYFSLPRGTSKTFKLRLRAAYEGQYTLPSITCEAMYNSLCSAATASGSTAVTK
ncbi:MAG: alpha-2-macroglobulin [Bacteroidales bacterium]|nr:alpha-2-macroglobulin [Bacteroidales bacterium]